MSSRTLSLAVASILVATSGAPAVPPCSPDGEHRYFPSAALNLDDSYTKTLKAMSEPPLSCGETDAESYRFVWHRSFHRPIVVRLEASSTGKTLVALELDTISGYVGKVAERIERPLLDVEWEALMAGLSATNFWGMPSTEPLRCCDGAMWLIEARRGDDYHVVERQSPEKGAFRVVGLIFLSLARLASPTKEIY